MKNAKAPVWGELLYHIGELYRDTASIDDLKQKLRDRGFDGNLDMKDCDAHPIARYLRSKIPDTSIYVGFHFVSLEYGDGGVLSISLPRPHEWGECVKPADKRNAGPRNRLAQSLWDGLDEIGIAYDKDADDVHGNPVAVIRARKIALFTRRCHAYQHTCIGGNEAQHSGIVLELQKKGWTVYTLWECQLRGGTAHLEVLLSVLKGVK